MNIVRRALQFALAVNKTQADAVVTIYGLIGIYRRLYHACGMPADVAARLEGKMLEAMYLGVEEQYAVMSRWVRGEVDFFGFASEYRQWFVAHFERCSEVAVQEFGSTA